MGTLSGLALLLPTACGYALWSLLLGWPRTPAQVAAALGAGWFVGTVGLGVLLGIATPPPAFAFVRVAPWIGVAAIGVAVLAWRLRGQRVAVAAPVAPPPAVRALTLALVLLLIITFVLLLRQAMDLPTVAWDAWNAWFSKPKAWLLADGMPAAVPFDIWFNSAPGSVMTTTAWFYPEALPRFALWVASASGGWNEAAVHAAWPFAWAALGLVCCGQLRLAGCTPLHALATTTALLTLPLATAHAALAGYADLWLAALLLLVVTQVERARALRSRRHAMAAMLCALLCLGVKQEAAIWLLCLAGGVALAWLPRRGRWALLLGLPMLWAIALPFGGWRLPLPGLGIVRLGWGVIELPALGAMQLTPRPVLDELAQALFLLPNWSLLWYVAPLIVALRWRSIVARRELWAWNGFLALGAAFLAVLFLLTDAAAWAENFTSVNRVLLQVVPALVAWLSLLWARPVPRDTEPASRA